MKNTFKILFVIIIATVMVISVLPATAVPVNTANKDTTDDNFCVSSKAKTVKLKITWNGNGGKIGTKNSISTSVNKGSKISKLPTTPKRKDFTFKGWYTKKIGGTKISQNTIPKKSSTYYAQWTKNTKWNDLSLVGTWKYSYGNTSNGDFFTYSFKKDRTFIYTWENYYNGYNFTTVVLGDFSASEDKLFLTGLTYKHVSVGTKKWNDMIVKHYYHLENGKPILSIGAIRSNVDYYGTFGNYDFTKIA